MTDWLRSLPVAHRGLHAAREGIPENSLAAFDRAASAGWAVELDVRLLHDGAVVVMHDETLERMTGDPRAVREVDTATLQALRLGGTDEPVPLLGHVLDRIGGVVPLLIEVKNESAAGALERAVAGCIAAYSGPVAVQTFHPDSLAELARRLPDIPCGFLFGPRSTIAGVAPGDAWLACVREVLMRPATRFAGCDVAPLPYDPVPELRGRMPLLGWTVRSPRERERAERWCDNVIFEGFAPAPGGV